MKKRIYNLDGLRFFAAWLVLTRHFHSIMVAYKLPGFSKTGFQAVSQPSVTLFFVISGFLITHVLTKNQTIDLKKFYRNRALRIWPLYYLVVLLVFFLIRHLSAFEYRPDNHSIAFNFRKFAGYILFLPNTTDFIFGVSHFLGVTWSLGVEEFFYLFYPLLLFLAPKKYQFKICLLLTILSLIVSVTGIFIKLPSSLPYRYELFFHSYLPRYRMYAFLLGALACFIWQKKWRIAMLNNKYLVAALWLLAPILFLLNVRFGEFNEIFFAIIFATGLYALVASGIKFSLLDNSIMNYLGKISYGIYLLHSLMIVFIINLMSPHLPPTVESAILQWLVITLITISVSAIIYQLYEKPFLRLKKN